MRKENVIRVLSIEGNPADAELIQEWFETAQRVGWNLPRFDVEHVDRLQTAIACLAEDAFDVVLSALDLPDSPADETIARLREHVPQKPIVVLTRRADEDLARRSVRAGVQDYLHKGEVGGSLLARTVMYALERQQSKDALQAAYDELECRVEERTAELARNKQGLQRERDKAQRYLNIAPSLIIMLDTEGEITFLNEMGADILECDQDAVIGKNWFDTFLPERVREEVRATFEQLISGDTQPVEYVENVILTGQGNERVVRWHNTLLRDDEGEIMGLLSSGQDITAQRRAKKESERRHKLWDALMENTPDLVYFKDENHRMIIASQAYAEIFDVAPQELIGKTAVDLWPEGEEILADERKVLGGEPIIRKERRVTIPAGESRWYLLTKIPVYEGDEIVGFFAMDKDITERKQAEDQLAFQSMLLDTIYDRVTATDLSGRITYVNQAECEMFGKTAEELIGQHVEQYGEDPKRGATQQEIIETTLSEGRWRGEVVNIGKGGREIVLDSRTQLVYNEQGNPIGMVGISTDITARKQMEETLERYAADLERSNEELQQFAYIVSHDLQAPLRAVTGYLNLLKKRYRERLDDKAQKYINSAMSGAERMKEMIRALLNLSRVKTRGEELTSTSAETVLKHVLDDLAPMIEESDAEVTHDPLPTVMADEAQLAQVFQNLIANGIKFRREGVRPRVHITARREGDEWVFVVEDNGIGIDPGQTDRIFQIFQRLHTREEYPGTGIGLALCRRIVERHGGRIWVESEVGTGSRFYFTLPGKIQT
jgi:PAS domain S-box-containing protein